ncbi:MAG: response regulator transcription factor, partial [Actinomycetota bacterium]
MISVLVADDQEIVRAGLTMILDAQPDIEVVGEAADGREAVELARQLRPDVCLFDVRMPGMDGIEATRQ